MGNVTMKDVAALAKVSVGTVSMSINDSPMIADDTKRKVLEAVKKLNYKPNPYAKSLSLSSSRSIGLLVPGFINPFFGELAQFIQHELDLRKNSLMIGITNDSSEKEKKVIDGFIDHGIDGLLIVPVNSDHINLNHIYDLNKSKLPTVYITSYYKGFQENCIMTNLSKGSYLITKHLLDKGFRSIVLVSGHSDLVPFKERIEGFVKAFDEMNLKVPNNSVIEASGMNFKDGYNAIQDFWKKNKPEAILAVNDVMAMGIISSLKAIGVRVPEDVVVAGYDDISISGIQETPLSTVKQPIENISKEAVSLLFDLIEGKPGIQDPCYFDPSIILRKSTNRKIV
jgi:DNA-binding LacI/PurR family transcriptional regulator